MGYSIAIRCRSPKLKEKMIAFMEQHYQLPGQVFNVGGSSRFSDDLDYDHAKSALGFDYGACPDPERHYIFTVTKWMALKIGRRAWVKDLKEYVPYIAYDGYETCPILPESLWQEKVPKSLRWAITDNIGYKPMQDSFVSDAQGILENGGFTQEQYDARVAEILESMDRLFEFCGGLDAANERLHAAVLHLEVEWKKQELTEQQEKRLWYQCKTCGNRALNSRRPGKRNCVCKKAQWKLMKHQQAWVHGAEDWEHPEGEI